MINFWSSQFWGFSKQWEGTISKTIRLFHWFSRNSEATWISLIRLPHKRSTVEFYAIENIDKKTCFASSSKKWAIFGTSNLEIEKPVGVEFCYITATVMIIIVRAEEMREIYKWFWATTNYCRIHGLQTPNEDINQRLFPIWASVIRGRIHWIVEN